MFIGGYLILLKYNDLTHVSKRMRYMAPLDGVRAIAILAVLVFHITADILPGGFAGVDAFFVLSGFLITSIITHELEEGRFSLREFYLRRIQRLLPNAVVTVAATLVLWTCFLQPNAAMQPAKNGLWTLFNLANIYIWKHLGGYWDIQASSAPLTHFWSLGVEEQFYLFFPTSLWLLFRWQGRQLLRWMVAVTLVSYGLCLYGTWHYPTATFYLLPTRLWELMLGGALAIWHAPWRIQQSPHNGLSRTAAHQITGWLGLIMLIGGFIFISEGDDFPGWRVLPTTIGTAFILHAVAKGESSLSRILSGTFLVGIGKLSYSLYLWHWPLIIFGKIQADLYGYPPMAGTLAGAFIGIALSVLAYHWIEKPLRDRGPGRAWRLGVIVLGFGVTTLGCGVLALHHFPDDPDQRFDSPTWKGEWYNAGEANRGNDLRETMAFSDVHLPPPPIREDWSWKTGGIVHLYGLNRPQVVVLGSSIANMYSRLVDDLCKELHLSVAFLGIAGRSVFLLQENHPLYHSPFLGHEFDTARKRFLNEWRPEVVLLMDDWGNMAPGFASELRILLQELSPLSGRVLFVAQAPALQTPKNINLRGLVTWRMRAENRLPQIFPDANESNRKGVIALAETAAKEFHNLSVIRADLPFYFSDGSIRYADGRRFFYIDSNHLSDEGLEEIRNVIRDVITGRPSSPKNKDPVQAPK